MPRVGSREWNRQQNLRRQSEEEQVVQAQIVFQQVDTVVIEAEPFECRRDILNLREQIQNKISQIEQLKNNAKEMKRINKETLRLNKELMNRMKDYKEMIKKYEKEAKEAGKLIKGFYDNNWLNRVAYENDDGKEIVSIKYIHTKLANTNSIDKYLNPDEELTDKDYEDIRDYRKISSYIKWLEDTLLAREECVDYIKKTGGWLGYYTERDDDITDKRLLEYTNNPLCKKLVEERIEKRKKKNFEEIEELIKAGILVPGGLNSNNVKKYMLEGDEEMKQAFIEGGFTDMDDLIEKRIQESNKKCCVICDCSIVGQYGNNPAPVKTTGRCCDECNVKVVLPARFQLIYKK